MAETATRSRIIVIIASIVLAFALAYAAARYGYSAGMHTSAELFDIVVSVSIFMITWHTRKLLNNNYLALIGTAYFFVGVVAALHMISYQNVGIVESHEATLPTHFWLMSRYLQAGAILVAPLFLGRSLDTNKAFGIFSVISSVGVAIIAAGLLPAAFATANQPTPFHLISNLLLIPTLGVGLVLLARRRDAFEPTVFGLLAVSIIFTMGAALTSTFFSERQPLLDSTSHLLHIVASYLVYRALIQTALEKPFSLLFRELKESEARLERLSVIDGMTGLYNHTYLMKELEEELRRARRFGHSMSVIMLDIDDFKEFNDTHGHLRGDQALRMVSDVIRSNMREVDTAARYGGEEFVTLLSHTDTEGAFRVAERIREGVAKTSIVEMKDYVSEPLTVSLGIATYPDHGDTIRRLVDEADHAMYKSKTAGKNRVSIAHMHSAKRSARGLNRAEI